MKFEQELPCHIAVINGAAYFSKDPFVFEGVQSQPVQRVCELDLKRKFKDKVFVHVEIHSIDEVPKQDFNSNPYVGLYCETSLVPEIIPRLDYKKVINAHLSRKDYPDHRGALIGWFYFEELIPHEQYINLVSYAARNKYYKDLEL